MRGSGGTVFSAPCSHMNGVGRGRRGVVLSPTWRPTPVPSWQRCRRDGHTLAHSCTPLACVSGSQGGGVVPHGPAFLCPVGAKEAPPLMLKRRCGQRGCGGSCARCPVRVSGRGQGGGWRTFRVLPCVPRLRTEVGCDDNLPCGKGRKQGGGQRYPCPPFCLPRCGRGEMAAAGEGVDGTPAPLRPMRTGCPGERGECEWRQKG
jgi:hypothetical protein